MKVATIVLIVMINLLTMFCIFLKGIEIVPIMRASDYTVAQRYVLKLLGFEEKEVKVNYMFDVDYVLAENEPTYGFQKHIFSPSHVKFPNYYNDRARTAWDLLISNLKGGSLYGGKPTLGKRKK